MRSERFLRTSSLVRFVLVPPPNPSQYICFQPKLPVESITKLITNDRSFFWFKKGRRCCPLNQSTLSPKKSWHDSWLSPHREGDLVAWKIALDQYIMNTTGFTLSLTKFKIQCTFKHWLHTHVTSIGQLKEIFKPTKFY